MLQVPVKYLSHALVVELTAGVVEVMENNTHLTPRQHHLVSSPDTRVLRNGNIVADKQLFIQFLTRPQTRRFYRNITIRVFIIANGEPLQRNHAVRKVDDLDGFPISRTKTSPPVPMAPAWITN